MGYNSKWSPTVYSVIKDMELKEKTTFTYEQWNAVRSSASYLGKALKRSYYVTKSGEIGEEGDIVVTRTL